MTNQDIRAALALLDPKDDSHWTEQGQPLLKALGLGDETPSRAQVTAVAPMFTRVNPDLGPELPSERTAAPLDPFLPREPHVEEEPQHVKDVKATMDWQKQQMADRVARAARNKAVNGFLKTQGLKPQKLAMAPIDLAMKNRPNAYVRAAALQTKKAAEATK